MGTPSRPTGSPLLTAAAALMTTAERARRDGVTAKCVRERIKAGRLPGVKVAGRWLVGDKP